MPTHCISSHREIKSPSQRKITADFSADHVSSDAGLVLLHQAESKFDVISQMASCFTDHRDPLRVSHSVLQMLKQRIFALACGYEDLNDHDFLSKDPLLAGIIGKKDLADSAAPILASRSTLNRLELTPPDSDGAHRYKRISTNYEAMERLFLEVYLRTADRPEEMVIDFDATDLRIHGGQEGRFFHGYYGHYCYLPNYAFCGDHLLLAQLRPANIDAALGTKEALTWMVPRIRQKWPDMRIIVRGDSGYCRDRIMTWCEQNGVEYVFGLAKNARLKDICAEHMAVAKYRHEQSGNPERLFLDFEYCTLTSWAGHRRVIGKAEYLEKGANPRFIVTNIGDFARAQELYEVLYCARGNMENCIKEQMSLFAERMSTHEMHGNQMRLWFSGMAYTLLQLIRTHALAGTDLSRAQCYTIRVKLLKIGALVQVTVRRIWVRMSRACPQQPLFYHVLDVLGT